MYHAQVDGPTKSAQVATSVATGRVAKTDITHSERGTRPSSELFPAIAAHLSRQTKGSWETGSIYTTRYEYELAGLTGWKLVSILGINATEEVICIYLT